MPRTPLPTLQRDKKSYIKISDEQIELIANIFSKGNQHLLADMEIEWLLSHAFQLGAKFYRDFTNE